MNVFDVFLFLLLLLGPIGLLLGWISFALSFRRREWPCRKVLPNLTLGAFVLATASALLAFHDPRAYGIRTLEIGILLSLAGLLLGMVGTYRASASRRRTLFLLHHPA
jgi:hypothetical protein